MAAVKEKQVSIRFPEETDAWLEEAAGGARKKAEFIRQLVEKARAEQQEQALLAMFNEAARHLTADDFAARERMVDAFAGRDMK